MATYTDDGEVYDAEDDEIPFYEDEYDPDDDEIPHYVDDDEDGHMSDRERREKEILRVHPFLVNRVVIVKDISNTRRKGWTSSGVHESKKGKSGKVVEVHSNVTEAVKIQFGPDDKDPHFFHYKDLMMAEVEEEEIPPVHFNPLNLVV